MANGPFNDSVNEELITNFLMKELFPAMKTIRELCSDVMDMETGLLRTIDRREINKKVKDYRIASKHFFDLYIKWNTPDVFYANLDKKISNNVSRMAGILQEQFNYNGAMRPHFDQGFRLLEQTDRSIAHINNSSFARLSLLTSTLALLVSVIAIIIALLIK